MPVDKISDSVLAAQAYRQGAKALEKPGFDKTADVSFKDFLSNSVQDATQTLRAGERASAQAVTGKAELADVVQAVSSAEITLQTIVAIRDRLIGAYQDIMRMPI
ncbi:MAG: flagellar hook-basal body complex protein FliE [Rhodospirillales bacterium]|nr:flagellar hook-basal body complex protein FliE [Rhodospirillales bacterium]